MVTSRSALPYVALVALTVTAYLPFWNNEFVDFDDPLHITQNPMLLQGFTGESIAWALTNIQGNYWQPLTYLSWQWDVHWFSTLNSEGQPTPSAAAFHGQNLFWHLGSACLLFALWRRLTGRDGCSFFMAALFALHPMHVESVAWATERKDVLCVFFGILTLILYVLYLQHGGRQWYLGMTAAYAASLMSKPMLITLPFVLLLLDYWPLGRLPFGQRHSHEIDVLPVRLGRLVLEKLPLFLLAAVIGVVTCLARAEMSAAVALTHLSLPARLANALTGYGWYVATTFWPTNLAVLYLHPVDDWSLAALLGGGGLLLVVTVLAIWQARRRPWLIVGWLWFVGSLLPVIGLVQGGMQAWADRFSYWPHIGLFVAVVFGLAEFLDRLRIPAGVRWVGAALVLLGLGGTTWSQVQYWQNTTTLWERVLIVEPDSHRGHIHLGRHLQAQGQLDKSRRHLLEAVKLQPGIVDYRQSLGEIEMSLGRFDGAAAQFHEILARDAKNVDAWHNLGVARLRQGKTANAIKCFHKVLELEPDASSALSGLGLAWWREGNRSQAIKAFELAIRKNPRDAEAWHGLGLASLTHGDLLKARDYFARALEIAPQSPKIFSDMGTTLGRLNVIPQSVTCHLAAVRLADQFEKHLVSMGGAMAPSETLARALVFRCRLAFALNRLGQTEDAKNEYRAAFERDPDWPSKFTRQAWWLATHPDDMIRDPAQAHELSSQALEGAGTPIAAMLDALAAANAALGYFQQAARTARQALDLAAADGDASARMDAIRGRLRLYEEGKAFVDHDSADEPFSHHSN